jgi:hypothetical protein
MNLINSLWSDSVAKDLIEIGAKEPVAWSTGSLAA